MNKIKSSNRDSVLEIMLREAGRFLHFILKDRIQRSWAIITGEGLPQPQGTETLRSQLNFLNTDL